jgi:hypothetical protein
MSQVAKSASAFARAFLAMLVLELEDMVVHWFGRPNSPVFMAIVGQFAWVSRLTSVSRLAPAWRARGFDLAAEAAKRALEQIEEACRPASLIHPVCFLAEVVYLERAKKLAQITIIERFVAVVRGKNVSPSWSDIRTALLRFNRAGLLVLCKTSTLRAKTTKHSCMPAWAWDTISSNPLKQGFLIGYVQT